MPLKLGPEDQRGIVSAALSVLTARNAAIEIDEVTIQDSYELGGGAFFHHLVWYGVPNVYLVLVAGGGHMLRGFHRLDLNERYGLPPAMDAVWRVP